MAKITSIHAAGKKKDKPKDDAGMGEYKKKLFLHRAGLWGKLLIGAAVVLCILIALRIWYANKTFTSYKTVTSAEHTATVDTSYVEYAGNILKYSRDGVSCISKNNVALWSQTYNMQSPIYDISDDEVIVADQGGNEAYVFDTDGLQAQISTLMPIYQVSISSGGVSAVLLDDGSSSYIYIYDSSGTELAEIKCSIDETGQPLSMAVSPDGAKLAVSYLQVQGGEADSCLVFYNFGSVGSNYVDKIVSSKVYSGEIIPRIEYMTDSLCVAVSDSGLIYFEGDEIPEESAVVGIDAEIQSVFFGNGRVGVILEGEDAYTVSAKDTAGETEDDAGDEETDEEDTEVEAAADTGTDEIPQYTIMIFDSNGRQIRTIDTDLDYENAKFSGRTIILYNNDECEIYSGGGVLRYAGAFESAISCIYKTGGIQKYVVVYADSTDTVKLQ